MSRSPRACGLKLARKTIVTDVVRVTLPASVWIETMRSLGLEVAPIVTLPASVWIETVAQYERLAITPVTLPASVWIETGR